MAERGKIIVLFDGVCNLCNAVVRFIIDHDKKDRFRFASLQGETGQALLKKFRLSSDAMKSFVLIDGEKVYTRSTGALVLCRHLGGAWNVLYMLIVIPPVIRDGVYRFVARNRYRWFGKRAACALPTPALQKKFLD
jgi:predicted DCC family thiol-disulfide oxidoreductase YuxK